MSFEIQTIPPFDRQLKALGKKYHSLKDDFAEFLNDLENNPIQGTELGANCYKIRFKISSKNRGKSGGARIISYVLISEETVYLLAIYDKSDQESISDKDIKTLLSYIK